MLATRIQARGFRNLAALDLALPPSGAVFLGANGHGKTNLLELLYYPVLFRSLRGARDADLISFGGDGFHLRLEVGGAAGPGRVVETGFSREARRKRVAVDEVEQPRVTDALGSWLAVAFLPSDVRLVSGGAGERRQYLDRVLSLADRRYLRSARQYRAALDQRNAALRQGEMGSAEAFEGALAGHGAELVRQRREWVAAYGQRWTQATADLGEPAAVSAEYRGKPELVDAAAWAPMFAETRDRDRALGATGLGPHRDDLTLRINGLPLRDIGSTGQQRTAAIALKLCERWTLAERAGAEPVLLLDDVFAELDGDRQNRLAAALGGPDPRQVFVTTPRREELPGELDLPVFTMQDGTVADLTERVPT